MKVGTIVRNTYQPSYESLLIYTGTSGKYAKCIWVINWEYHGVHNFFKKDILEDREHFPVVGFYDYKKALVDGVKKAVVEAAE